MTRRVPWWHGVLAGALVAAALLGAKAALPSGSPDSYRPSAPVQDTSVSSAVADPSPGEACAILVGRIGGPGGAYDGPTPEEVERAFADRPHCLAEWRKSNR